MEKNKAKQLLGFGEFLLLMKNFVKEAVGEGYNVEINHVVKNNSIELDGLIVLKEKESITPNIYMNSYYEKYLAGGSVKEMVEDIILIYEQSRVDTERNTLHIRYELDEMKSCIIFRLINYDRNRKLLLDVPYIQFMDLAVTFHCLVKNNEKGIGTIRITNEHIRSWMIDIEYLKEIARVNTPILFPPVVRDMNEILYEMLEGEGLASSMSGRDSNELSANTEETISNYCPSESEDYYQMTLHGAESVKTNVLYVITNDKGINGASCLLYPEVIKQLALKLDSDLYILPSSIHEIIAVKANETMNKKVFREMVFDVNRTQVPEEDILSDNVYYYSRNRDAITL
jgi:hypothetical protein